MFKSEIKMPSPPTPTVAQPSPGDNEEPAKPTVEADAESDEEECRTEADGDAKGKRLIRKKSPAEKKESNAIESKLGQKRAPERIGNSSAQPSNWPVWNDAARSFSQGVDQPNIVATGTKMSTVIRLPDRKGPAGSRSSRSSSHRATW